MSGDEQRVGGVRVVGIDANADAAGENGAGYALDFMKGGYSRRLCESRPQCRGIAGARICLHARGDRWIGRHLRRAGRPLRGNGVAGEPAVIKRGSALPQRPLDRSTYRANRRQVAPAVRTHGQIPPNSPPGSPNARPPVHHQGQDSFESRDHTGSPSVGGRLCHRRPGWMSFL